MTQDQDDHHDSSSSSSEDDEDVIRPKHSASRRDPQSKTEIPDKGKGKGEEKESPAPTAHRAPDSDHNNDYQTAPLLASVNDHQEEPSRAPITRSAARSLCIEVTPINLSNDDDPSPFSKAKRGNNSRETGKSSPKRSCSNEDDGSPTKPAWWTSQKRNNGRFSS
ncbi:hypothetical protein D6C99_10114 [Aureobasidium pullulans]|nr:hypothetical protein D6C99_10114 [Aureobasidium pullulans]